MDIDDEQEKDSLSGFWDRIITDTSTKQPNFMKHTIASAKRQSLGNKIKRDRQIVDLRKEFSSISITSGSKQVSKAIQKQQQQQPGGTEKLESNKKEKRKRKPLKINTIILESNENQFNLPPSEEKVTIPSRCLPKQSLRRQEFTTKRKSKSKLALQNMNMQIWPENNPLKSPTHTTKETEVVDETKRTKQHDTSKKILHVHKKRVLQKALYISKLNEIIKEFRQEHKGSLIRAHLAYKADCPDKIFILAYVHCPIKTKMWRLYKGLKVLFMDYLYVDSEAIRVAADKKSSTMKLSETVENELRKSITQRAHDLMSSHSNLQILSGSPVRSKQKGQVIKEEQCIVLFCRNKGYIPLGEKWFPKKNR